MRALESATLGKNMESISKGEEEKEEERKNDRNIEAEQSEERFKERAVAIDGRTKRLSVESIKNRVRACSSGVSELDMEKALAGKTSEEMKRIENESRQVAAGVVTESLGYLKEMLSNVPGSAKRVVEGVGSAAAHPVRTVRETFDLIFTVLAGKLEGMFGYENLPEQQALEKIRSDFGKTHGSISAELDTLKKDPVGEGLAIASIVTGGTGMAREAVGLAGKIGSVGRVAEIEQAGAIVRTGEGVTKAEQAVSRGVTVEETEGTAFSAGKMMGEAGSEGEFPGAVSLETKVATLGAGGKNLNRIREVEEVLPDAEFPVETADVPASMNAMEDISHIGAIEKAGALGGAVKSGEMSGPRSEEVESKKEKFLTGEERQDIRSFSKRFAPFRRDELAQNIRDQRRTDRQERAKVTEENEGRDRRREEISTDIEALKIRQSELEKTVSEIELSIRSDKSRLFSRIQEFCGRKNLKRERALKTTQEQLDQVQNEIEEKNKILGEMQNILFEETHLEKAKSVLEEFYGRQGDIKTMYESESNIRDVESISRKYNTLFVHSMPEGSVFQKGTGVNNPGINTGEDSGTKERVNLIRGIKPTISTSTLENSDYETSKRKEMYQAGVIIGGGRVVSAYRGDAATLTHSLFSKKAKYDRNPFLSDTSIQNDIEERIDDAINKRFPESPAAGKRVLSEEALGRSGDPVNIDGSGYAYGWNELVVEDPKISGLYIREGFHFDPWKYVDLSERLNIPLYFLGTGGEIRKWDEEWLLSQAGFESWEFKDRMRKSSFDEIMNSTPSVTQEERLDMIDDLLKGSILRGEKFSREVQNMKRAFK